MKFFKSLLFILIASIAINTQEIAAAQLRWDWQNIPWQQEDFLSKLYFPQNFVWGVGDSAYQTEGPIMDNGALCQNTWTVWEKTNMEPDQHIGIACDRWNRYKQDYQLLKDSGFTIYRTSVEWSKIEPQEGVFDEKALQHYRDAIDELLRLGITPIVVLYHHTEPTWFADKYCSTCKAKGFECSHNNKHFTAFGLYVFHQLHDKVKIWMTFNEPTGIAMTAFDAWLGNKPHPGGQKGLISTGRTLRNYLNAHIDLYHEFKRIDPSVKVGYTTVITPIESYGSWDFWDKIPAALFDNLANNIDLYYFKTGKFRWNFFGIPLVSCTNKKAIGALDFIGTNYYTHVSIKNGKPQPQPGEIVTDNGNVIYPEGMYRTIKRVGNILGKDFPQYIAENGVADNNDQFKNQYIKQHLYAVSQACKEGYNILGYFYWTLMDNYEWVHGYKHRFGLYHVDFATQQRTLNPGAYDFINFVQSQNAQVGTLI